MTTIRKRIPPVTVDDYRALPETGPQFQLIEGELYMSPSPTRFHQRVSRNLQLAIETYLETHPVGELYNAPLDVYLTDISVTQPDLFFVATDNRDILEDDGAHGAPDFVIEILSPATADRDTGAKKALYAREGVKHYWIVDPDKKEIAVFDFAADAEKAAAVYRSGDTFASPLFPGLEFSADAVFRM